MPDILVEVRGFWLGGRKAAFLDAIHAAVAETLRTPADDKVLRLIEHAPDAFLIPLSAGARFTHIEITLFAGRSPGTKRALYRAIVDRLAPFGVPAADVKIVLIEVPAENVGLRGGKAAADIALGYEVRI
jgi:hypothetical protein